MRLTPLAALTAIAFSALANAGFATDAKEIPIDLGWLEDATGLPVFVWENREDAIYHEVSYPNEHIQAAPEIFALQRCPWVFNRAMRWVDGPDGTQLAFEAAGDLALTGTEQVSRWYSAPANRITEKGGATRFEKRSLRKRDCAVLPAFQFHAGQHPRLHVKVSEADADWQFVVSIKGRSGPPTWSSGWRRGTGEIDFDLAGKLDELGYRGQFPELHFVIGTWGADAATPANVEFSAELVSQPAIVANLPVIRSTTHAAGKLPLTVTVRDASGAPLPHEGTDVWAEIEGRRFTLTAAGELWHAMLEGLPLGDHDVLVRAHRAGLTIAPARTVVRLTDGRFPSHDPTSNTISLPGEPPRPLTGSFQGTFFYRDVGLPSQTLVNTQHEWDAWDRTVPPGEHLLYWEALTERELDARFAHLQANGWDLLHLHSHYGIWEKFEAFGHPAPHATEQFAAYVRAASRHGLRVMLSLTSYPYSVGTKGWEEGTHPYAQTIEAGFKNEDWYDPSREPFGSSHRAYLRAFTSLFRDETAVFSWSSSGEGDWKGGVARFQDSLKAVRAVDTNHLFVAEPMMWLDRLPEKVCAGFTSAIVGGRNYTFGRNMPFEREMAVQYRAIRMLPNGYLAEGSFPANNLYAQLTFSQGNPDRRIPLGSPEYRRCVRDTVYLGLVNRMPVLMTWDEVFTEDERVIFADAARRFPWTAPVEAPRIAAIIDDTLMNTERPKLGELEAWLTSRGLSCRYLSNRAEALPGETVLDVTARTTSLNFGAAVPTDIADSAPVRASPGFAVTTLATRGRTHLLSYLCNASAHQDEPPTYLGPRTTRAPAPAPLQLTLRQLSPASHFRLHDLNERRLVSEGTVAELQALRLPPTTHDFLLEVAP
ncbi:carboxypeptidase-like regulatory domain-containing protein [Nibricoccus sp. IMCC34717]|uniref:carboxypeptidase-like regulatory domain-containing protein n=1 Tax=Nibricoccus sp. IMCC34717 TaxID=3034021 RepID=UPI00384D7B87